MSAIPAGYKQTEVGVIPDDWDCFSVDQLISESILAKPLDGNHGNIHPKSSDFVSHGIPFVMANNVKDGIVDLINCSFIRKEQADSLQKGFSLPGDVLLTHKATIGQTAIVGDIQHEFIMLTPQVTYYRVANTERLNNGYLRQYFEGATFQRILQSLSGGGTRLYIGITAQRNLPVVVPPIAEQRAIAAALSDVDALLAKLDQLIAKKRDLKQATMQQLLTGQTRLPGFSGAWEVKQVFELGEVVTGGTPRTDVAEYWGDEYPWVTPTDISTRRDMFSTERQLTQKGLDAVRSLPPNTVLVTCIASIGKNAVLKTLGACNQQINAVAPNRKNDAAFLYYIFEASKQYLQTNAGTTATSIISKTIFSELVFRIPELDEQTAIAAVLSDMDAELATLEARRDKTRALKQSMMQELLTGRIRLA